jgi:hypothetical protein
MKDEEGSDSINAADDGPGNGGPKLRIMIMSLIECNHDLSLEKCE